MAYCKNLRSTPKFNISQNLEFPKILQKNKIMRRNMQNGCLVIKLCFFIFKKYYLVFNINANYSKTM